MTPSQLELDLKAFAAHLLSPLTDKPVVKHQILGYRPLKVRLGLRAAGVSAEAVQAAINATTTREAWLATWQTNTHGGIDPQSIAVAGDDKHVVMDLVFFGLTLATPEHLTPA